MWRILLRILIIIPLSLVFATLLPLFLFLAFGYFSDGSWFFGLLFAILFVFFAYLTERVFYRWRKDRKGENENRGGDGPNNAS